MTDVQSILFAAICIAGVMLMISMLVPADTLERLYAWVSGPIADQTPEASSHRTMPWERTRARVSDDVTAGYTHLQEDDACQCVECAPLLVSDAPSLSARLECVGEPVRGYEDAAVGGRAEVSVGGRAELSVEPRYTPRA